MSFKLVFPPTRDSKLDCMYCRTVSETWSHRKQVLSPNWLIVEVEQECLAFGMVKAE